MFFEYHWLRQASDDDIRKVLRDAEYPAHLIEGLVRALRKDLQRENDRVRLGA